MRNEHDIIKQLNNATSVRETNRIFKSTCAKCMNEDMGKSCQYCLIRLTRNIIIEKKFDDEGDE